MVFGFLFSLCADASAQTYRQWGNLKSGPYAVGFKVVRAGDNSQTAQKSDSRPVNICVWYPAKRKPGASRMTVEQYAYLGRTIEKGSELSEEEKRLLQKELRGFYENADSLAFGSIPDSKWNTFMQMRSAAMLDAETAKGRFPLIIGKSDPFDHFPLDEYLASHGYIVARAMGAQSEPSPVADLRCLELAMKFLQNDASVDSDRIGAIGFSIDAFPAYLLAMKSAEVDALIAMDSPIFTREFASGLRMIPFYNVEKLKVPFLHMGLRKEIEKEERPGDFDALRHSKRFRFLLNDERVSHADYSAHGVLATTLLNVRGKSSSVAREAFEWTWRYALHFFNACLKDNRKSIVFISRRPEANGVPRGFLTLEIKNAQGADKAPPR